MPYFIYHVKNPRQLEHIDTKTKYQDAKALVRERRSELDPEERFSVRMIFANNQQEAEKILSAPRDERVIGED